jgi:alpha-beta hydrolase superfamily lysophospholipase
LKRRAQEAPAIAYRILRPKGPAKAAVLLSHGYFENQQRYRHVVERWNELGLLAAVYDLRGHGLSEGRRGFITRFDEYVDDLFDVLAELDRDDQWKQLRVPLLFGHSTGGLIAIHAALRSPERIRGLALSSPYLGQAREVPAPKLLAGRALSRFLPIISMPTGMSGSDCTHSRDIAEAYDRDPMNFKKANVRWFTETMAAQEQAIHDAPGLTVPIFCLQAGEDKVGVAAATERFMERVSSADRQYQLLPGLYHEILNEPDRATWIDKFASAMLAFQPKSAAVAAAPIEG